MKKIIKTGLVLTLVTLFAVSFANNFKTNSLTIKGRVIDVETGETLTGVKIDIESLGKTVYSDFDGNFEIDDVKPGEYNLVASLISYNKSLVEKIELDHNQELSIELKSK